MLKIYLVGGAIRDKLLELKIDEKDWIILNSNYKTMIKLGFKIVGKDFPVFLHPITKEEYALARKEKKIKIGYNGFKCYFFSTIKLKDDLFRRDITINSLILNESGKIKNYFNGIEDLKNKKINHISNAFLDDPLRLLRIARFSSKFSKNGFLIASKTYKLVKKILKKEINKLTTERVIKEILKSINYNNSYILIHNLNVCKKLKYINYELYLTIKKSKKFIFNKELNLWKKIIKILINLKDKTNNKFIKLSIINSNNKNNEILKTKINKYLSKKYLNFILNLNLIKKNYNIINLKKIIDININKNKIKLLNIILICETNTKLNSYYYNFYLKYIIIEIFDKLTKKKFTKTDNKNNNIKKFNFFNNNLYIKL